MTVASLRSGYGLAETDRPKKDGFLGKMYLQKTTELRIISRVDKKDKSQLTDWIGNVLGGCQRLWVEAYAIRRVHFNS